ncbi:MAG: hypothetical protein HY774_20390 [Acidobacteria bacterium]|nr:hypothetical protein [Acidobacteriota bacterium]
MVGPKAANRPAIRTAAFQDAQSTLSGTEKSNFIVKKLLDPDIFRPEDDGQ